MSEYLPPLLRICFAGPANCCYFQSLNRVQLFVTVARHASLSMGFPRQEYWSGLPCPPPGIFLTQGSHLCLLGWRQSLYH